jgi:hypothetical protein
MSRLTGWLTPEARAGLEAMLARLAAPGMCNPADATPCVDGSPLEDAIQADTRSEAQRNHDALNAALRAVLASGKLGQHNGLPASIIVTTTLKDLEAGCGKALTGGGSLLSGAGELASEIFGLPARVGYPVRLGGLVEEYHDPMFSTGVGLVMYGATREGVEGFDMSSSESTFTSVWERMRTWFKDFF